MILVGVDWGVFGRFWFVLNKNKVNIEFYVEFYGNELYYCIIVVFVIYFDW